MLKVLDTGSSCVERGFEDSEIGQDDDGILKVPTCLKFKKNGPKTVAMERMACLEYNTQWVDLNDGKGLRQISDCVKTGRVALARTQRLDTYYDNGTFSERQNSGSAMYTIPDCE